MRAMGKKSEGLFDLARYIGSNGGIGVRQLHGVFPGLSERGMFRYLKTLVGAGVLTRSKARYTLKESWAELFEDVKRGDALETLLSAGMKACEDEDVLQKAREVTKHWRHGAVPSVSKSIEDPEANGIRSVP